MLPSARACSTQAESWMLLPGAHALPLVLSPKVGDNHSGLGEWMEGSRSADSKFPSRGEK